MKTIKLAIIALIYGSMTTGAQVDYSVVQVNQESGLNLVKVTNDNDLVCMPAVKRSGYNANWFSNRIIDISVDGKQLAYVSSRNNSTNIFIKDLGKQGGSVQRTNRQAVLDFSYSPDGKYICFSEASGAYNQIFQTDANNGYVCRQITSNSKDFSPVYSSDMKNLFFSRQEMDNVSIWGYSISNNFLSSYTQGMNPQALNQDNILLCTRLNANGKGEIWRIDYKTGIEECIVSDPNRSFSTPSLSPDGQWIVMVGSNTLMNGSATYTNTDIFICRIDGTQLNQVTYHAADDLSPVWSRNGKYIFFISQRGSANGTANVWRINFTY